MKEPKVKPEEYDVVRLRRPLPEHDLPAGAKGAVVMDLTRYSDSGAAPAYEVEFTDGEGGTTAVVTVAEEDLEVFSRSGQPIPRDVDQGESRLPR